MHFDINTRTVCSINYNQSDLKPRHLSGRETARPRNCYQLWVLFHCSRVERVLCPQIHVNYILKTDNIIIVVIFQTLIKLYYTLCFRLSDFIIFIITYFQTLRRTVRIINITSTILLYYTILTPLLWVGHRSFASLIVMIRNWP